MSACALHNDHSPNVLVPAHHHIIPRSWYPGAVPSDAEVIEVGDTCHTNVHYALDQLVRAAGPGNVAWDIKKHIGRAEWAAAVQGYELAIGLGLTPKPTL